MLAALIEKQCSERKVNEPRRARFGVERERQHCEQRNEVVRKMVAALNAEWLLGEK